MIHTPNTPGWTLSRPIDQPFTINYDSPQAAGLVALWTCFNQRGVPGLRDSIGEYDMAAVNTPPIVNDFEMGPVVSFLAANTEYLEIDLPVVTATPLTIACWFYSTSVAIAQALVQICELGQPDELYALTARGDAGGDPVTLVRIAGAGPNFCDTTTSYVADKWQHAAAVCWDDSACDVYLDGGGKGSVGVARAPGAWDRTSIARAGDSTPGSYMSGRIAEARIYDRPLTEMEVWQLYAPETRWELYSPVAWFIGGRAPDLARIPRPPAAYNTLAIY